MTAPRRIFIVLAVVGLVSCGREEAEQSRARLSQTGALERAIFDELNGLRTDPEIYTKRLHSRSAFYKDNLLELPGRIPVRTSEGIAALEDATDILSQAHPMPPLTWSPGLSSAARDLGRDIGPKGLVTHSGSDGSAPADRMHRYLPGAGSVGEAISFGPNDPESVVADLIVDDGVPGRGHRKILMNPAFRFAGVACGHHRQYQTMCVIDLADRVDGR